VEFNGLSQMEDPARAIDLVHLPAGGKAGGHIGRLINVLEIPIDQRVVRWISQKAEPFAAVVRNAAGCRNVGRGHTDPHDLVGVSNIELRDAQACDGDE